MAKVLVTGGGGFLGLYLVEQLLAQGDQVHVFCRNHHARFDQMKISWIAGDLRDSQSVHKACQDMDIVFHTAAIPGIWGAWKTFYETNTLGTQHVIQACQQQKVSKLIYTSSPSVIFAGQDHQHANESLPYPSKFLCHYPHSKALAEQAVLAANDSEGLLTVSLRPHLIWGPRDNHLIPRLIQRAQAGRLRQVGDGTNLISMSYVENVAAAHLQAATALKPESPVAGQAYFINDPEPVLLWGWVNQLLTLAGVQPLQKKISARTAYVSGALMEFVYRVLWISKEPLMTRFLALQLSQHHYYDISKAERDFEYQPIVSVEEGMRRLAQELSKN